MTLIATVGASNANSYISVADADAYFTNRYSSGSWASSTTAIKEQVLITATQRLEQEEYISTVVDTTQALKWPRTSILKPSGVAYYENTVIPAEVMNATAELGHALITQLTTIDEELDPRKYASLTVGPISVVHRSAMSGFRMPDIVRRYLAPYLITPSAFNVQVYR